MKIFFILIMVLTFCNISVYAQFAKEDVSKKKDTIDSHRTYEDRIVTKSDYINDTLRKFYNSKWEEDSNWKATYYSIAYKKDGSWICYDYYVPENKIFHYVTFSDYDLKNKHGLFVSYTSEGSLAEFGNYNNNNKTGNWLLYTDKGDVPDTTTYLNGIPVGKSIMHYPDGKIRSVQEVDTLGNGVGKRTNYYDYDKGIVQETALYSKGMKKDSTWVYFYPNGKISFLEKYNKDTLLAINCYDINGVSLDSCIIDQVPEFPGGLPALQKFLSKNIKYPKAARQNGIQGRVIVQFVVDKDGSIINIAIKRNIDGGCGEEAARIVSLMPQWKPGKHYGNTVKVYYTLPVTFKLN